MSSLESPLIVKEIFHSIQGESTHTGLPYIFIRLTGCNLRCHYCDSAYAFHGGEKLTIDQILNQIKKYKTKNVLLTGGEPLIQKNAPLLVKALKSQGYKVSIETHGEVSIESVKDDSRIVMDIKTPGSGITSQKFLENLPFLKSDDEIKFVITSEQDYDWAKSLIQTHSFNTKHILFSAANIHPEMPGQIEAIPPKWLAEKILEDELPVRLQFQVHKLLWGNKTGV